MLKCVVLLKMCWEACQLMWKRSGVDGLKRYLPKKKQQNGIFRSEVIMWKETRNSTNCILGVRIICLEELLSVVAVTE